MPSDPVLAVFWFSRWLLQVLVRYFYLLILVGIVYETYLNGAIGLLGTLLVGLVVWAGLAVLLVIAYITSGISRFYSQITHFSQNPYSFTDFVRPTPEKEENVVEGSIITDLNEERKKRRQETS
jgi:hypothetical protein